MSLSSPHGIPESIDIHPHVISTNTDRYPLNPLGGTRSSWSEAHPLSHDELATDMKAAGMNKAVVVQSSTTYGHDNSYLADAVAAHPEMFTGVFSVDMLAPDAIEKIDHWRGRGLTGLRIFSTGTTMPTQGDWLGDPASYPAWAHAEKLGLPVCLQMRPEGIPRLMELLERFPDAVIVLDHAARSDFSDGAPFAGAQGLWDLAKHPGTYLKLTQRVLDAAMKGASTMETLLDKLMQHYGADRIAWGSNYPAADEGLPQLLERTFDALSPLSAEEKAMIFAGTAKRIYPVLTGMKGLAA